MTEDHLHVSSLYCPDPVQTETLDEANCGETAVSEVLSPRDWHWKVKGLFNVHTVTFSIYGSWLYVFVGHNVPGGELPVCQMPAVSGLVTMDWW